MNQNDSSSVHPLLAFVLSLGFTEQDLMKAGAAIPRIEGFSLAKVSNVREPTESETHELGLTAQSRMFLWTKRRKRCVLQVVSCKSQKHGEQMKLRFSTVDGIKSGGLCTVRVSDGGVSSHDADTSSEPETDLPVDAVIPARPHFIERGISR